MPLAIQMRELGSPDVLVPIDLPPEPLQADELRVQHTAIGFNYLDVYLRTGVYGVPLPAVLGVEAVGRVTEVGESVTGFAIGDRVAYSYALGAYTTERRLKASWGIPLPDDVSDESAAVLLLKGQTAHMLLKKVYRVQAGDTILVHAAAGGVGLVLTRWAKALGARVIATVGSPAKADIAKANGADYVAVLGQDDVAALARAVTRGAGVDVVYDSIGHDTYEASLKSLRPFGVMASYGLASGDIAPIEPRQLSRHGSIFYIRAAVDHYIADPARYHETAAEVLQLIRSGVLVDNIGQQFPLKQAAEAHRRAESRKTTGATLLIP